MQVTAIYKDTLLLTVRIVTSVCRVLYNYHYGERNCSRSVVVYGYKVYYKSRTANEHGAKKRAEYHLFDPLFACVITKCYLQI